MKQPAALMMAIGLLQMPTHARLMRKRPLPDGVVSLLRIVAGDEDATSQAVEASGRRRETVQEASVFFVEQMLFHPEADSYRVLGAKSEASSEELRRNMALLVRWLHPDVDGSDGRSLFAHRVTKAWNDLKTEERRIAYGRAKPSQGSKGAQSPRHRRTQAKQSMRPKRPTSRRPPVKRTLRRYPRRMGVWHRLMLLVFGRVIR